jgi:methylthioxylose transferase
MKSDELETPPSQPLTAFRRRAVVGGAVALAIGAALLGWATIWGRRVQTNPDVKLGAAPLVGQWKFRPSIGYLMPIGFALLVIVVIPRLFVRLQTRWVVLSTVGLAGSFTAALAGADGGVAMLDPVVHRTEYWAWLDKMPPVRQMLTNYDEYDFIVNFSTHIKGHPPGYMLLLKALAALGLGKPWIIALVSYVSAGLVAGSVLVVARRLGTAKFTRRAAPLLILAPYAVWMGTSADAVFSALVAVGAAGLAIAATSAQSSHRITFSVLAGLSIGAGLYSSWGTVTCAPILAGVLWCATRQQAASPSAHPASFGERIRRAAPIVAWASTGIGAVAVTMTALGYNWFAGMGLTRRLYWKGTAQFRPWKYFLVGNMGALLFAIGIVAVVGLGVAGIGVGKQNRSEIGTSPTDTQPTNWLRWLIICALTCVLAANFSQYSKGEVERIWLPFMPWLTLPAALLTRHRLWLLVQATSAIGLQVMLISKW